MIIVAALSLSLRDKERFRDRESLTIMKPEMSEFCQKDMGKGNFNFYVILMILLLSLVCIYFPISLV